MCTWVRFGNYPNNASNATMGCARYRKTCLANAAIAANGDALVVIVDHRIDEHRIEEHRIEEHRIEEHRIMHLIWHAKGK